MIYFIGGKPGAGKTHYAKHLKEELEILGRSVYWLDGDEWRKQTKNNDFSDVGRRYNLLGAAQKINNVLLFYDDCILSFVAPKKIWRDEMRTIWNQKICFVYLPGGVLWEDTSYESPLELDFGVN